MNFDKISIILKKISRLIDTLKEADIEVSAIEKELIQTYIRELQSEVGGDTPEKGKRKVFADAISSEQESHNATADIAEEKEEEEEVFTTLREEPEEETYLTRKEPEEEQPEESTSEESAETEEEPYSEELEALFEIKTGTDLSDKLSLSPIKDLRKSMGVNERIFTINELFNGDQRLFDEVILHLNNLSNFDSAASYLKEKVARDNDWDNKEKKKKAEHFIRLIYRRYL